MGNSPLNTELLKENTCFGCGHMNPRGLQIEVIRDSSGLKQLLGKLHTTEEISGFPGITHGGAIYTALDCLATWVATILRPEQHVFWVLRSAEMIYHKPAKPGLTIQLLGKIIQEGKSHQSIIVLAEARDDGGELLAEGKFKEIPLTIEQFKQVSGLNTLPDNWKEFIERSSHEGNK